MTTAKLVTCILVTDTIGRGVEGDPVQRRTQLFTLSGELLATVTALGDLNAVHGGPGWSEIENCKSWRAE